MLYTKKNNFIINIIIVMTKIFIFFLILIIIVCFYLTIHKENFSELGSNKIPKIIIQTWVDKNPPEKYQKDIQSIKEKNLSYQYIF